MAATSISRNRRIRASAYFPLFPLSGECLWRFYFSGLIFWDIFTCNRRKKAPASTGFTPVGGGSSFLSMNAIGTLDST